MNEYESLKQAVDMLRPELPDLVGQPWPGFQAELAHCLAKLVGDASSAAEAKVRILALFGQHPRAYQRLVAVMAEQQVQAMQSASRAVPLRKLGLRPAVATRYIDITCPRQVSIDTRRVAVVVRLTTGPAMEDQAADAIALLANIPVTVRVDAPGFELLGPAVQEIAILKDRDSLPAVFYLRPTRTGHAQVTLDFFQAGDPVGTATAPIEVAAGKVFEKAGSYQARTLQLSSVPSPPDMVLHIAYRATPAALEFTLIRDGGAWMQTFAPVAITSTAQAHAAALYRTITSLVDSVDPTVKVVLNRHYVIPAAEVDRRIKQLGQNLWRSLVPTELKQLYALERASWQGRTMLVLSDEPYLPWELVWPYDATGWEDPGPWCSTLYLTRWLRKDAQGNGNEKPPTQLKLQAWSVLAPTYSLLPNLAGAQHERQVLLDIAARHDLVDVSPPAPKWGAVIEHLESGAYDWLHAAAHGSFYAEAPDSDSALWLEQDRALTPDAVVGAAIESHLRTARPAFFFNACQVGRQDWALTQLGGWANRLISAGAGLFVGPLWEVSDQGALAFAQSFYSSLLGGDTVAEAVHAGRMAARRAGDPTWLAYSVYAHPNARVINGRTV